MPALTMGRGVEKSFQRVINQSRNDKIGILSHEGMDPTDCPCRNACDRQSMPPSLRSSSQDQPCGAHGPGHRLPPTFADRSLTNFKNYYKSEQHIRSELVNRNLWKLFRALGL